MGRTVYFVARCSKCQRPNQLAISLLGTKVACEQCHTTFIARDEELESAAMQESVGEFARSIDWEEEKLIEINRPR